MTNSSPGEARPTAGAAGAVGPVAGADGHPGDELLASYAAGTAGTVTVWSVEAHLTGCAHCRSALSVQVDGERLAHNRSVLLARAAIGGEGRVRRLLRRCGLPDHMLSLLAATTSLRRSWLLSVLGVLAVVAAESAVAGYNVLPGHASMHIAGYPGESLTPFLLVAPLLVLAGVTAAFLPMFDPAARLAVAAPFSSFTLLLIRSVSALAAALLPVTIAALLLPGPGWLPIALLLPSLALCAFALAAATVLPPRAAVLTAGGMWAVPAILLAVVHVPLLIVQRNAQFACAATLCACAVVLLVRHDRFEWGWTR